MSNHTDKIRADIEEIRKAFAKMDAEILYGFFPYASGFVFVEDDEKGPRFEGIFLGNSTFGREVSYDIQASLIVYQSMERVTASAGSAKWFDGANCSVML